MSPTEKMLRLMEVLREHTPLLIAFSGGVDSAFLLAAAQKAIPGQFLGVIADSPSLPRTALSQAVELAKLIGAPLEILETREMENPEYVANPLNRCYFCKAELFQRMERLAEQRAFRGLAYGENADDAFQDRPGRVAAGEFRVLAPLNAAGLSKTEIRELSRQLGLPTADAPAQPCLSSRIPHGTPVTPEALDLVERGEEWVRSLGFAVFRVRFRPPHGAWVQIAPEENELLLVERDNLIGGLRAVGFDPVEFDPAGYRSPKPALA